MNNDPSQDVRRRSPSTPRRARADRRDGMGGGLRARDQPRDPRELRRPRDVLQRGPLPHAHLPRRDARFLRAAPGPAPRSGRSCATTSTADAPTGSDRYGRPPAESDEAIHARGEGEPDAGQYDEETRGVRDRRSGDGRPPRRARSDRVRGRVPRRGLSSRRRRITTSHGGCVLPAGSAGTCPSRSPTTRGRLAGWGRRRTARRFAASIATSSRSHSSCGSTR